MNKILSVNLHEAIKEVKITKFSKLPVLNHAKLEFSNGELTITTTDGENSYLAKVPCIMEEEFSTCVPMILESMGFWTVKMNKSTRKFYPFHDFIQICAKYKDVLEFTFDHKTQTLTIKVQGERSITQFKCIDAEEFTAVAENLRADIAAQE